MSAIEEENFQPLQAHPFHFPKKLAPKEKTCEFFIAYLDNGGKAPVSN